MRVYFLLWQVYISAGEQEKEQEGKKWQVYKLKYKRLHVREIERKMLQKQFSPAFVHM